MTLIPWLTHATTVDCFISQAMTYDHILSGRDIIGKSRTGTGKTIAFGLPVIQHLGRFADDDDGRSRTRRGRSPRFLVICPTRELARQVTSSRPVTTHKSEIFMAKNQALTPAASGPTKHPVVFTSSYGFYRVRCSRCLLS